MKHNYLLTFRNIFRMFFLLAVIFLNINFSLNSCQAQQGVQRKVNLLSYVFNSTNRVGNYAVVLAKRYIDADNNAYFIDLDGESRCETLRLFANGGFGTSGSLCMDCRSNTALGKGPGKITSSKPGVNFYVDLNSATPEIVVSSLRTTDRIAFFGNLVDMPAKASTSMTHKWPVQGKHVYDLAEGVRVSDDCQAGDVVVISSKEDRLFVKTNKAFDTKVAGVISKSPKLLMGNEEGKVPLALAGIVECKVTAENGPIKKGDLLVCASEPGFAMRADAKEITPGMVLGSALDKLDSGKGKIQILVNQ